MSIEANATPKARRKPTKPSTHRKEADRLWSLIIRRNGLCVADGWHRTPVTCAGPVQAAHFIRRAKSGTRTDLDNGAPWCLAHHTWFDSHPADLIEFVNLVYGAGTYQRLQAKADGHTGSPITAMAWWKSERARLREIANRLEIR